MQKMLDFLFTEEEALTARMLVTCGLLAYALSLIMPLFGSLFWIILAIIQVLVLALLCYSALRELLPMMDPRDAEADRYVVWGAFVIFLAIGWTGFGILLIPALCLGVSLLWIRAPEILEVIPFMEKP